MFTDTACPYVSPSTVVVTSNVCTPDCVGDSMNVTSCEFPEAISTIDGVTLISSAQSSKPVAVIVKSLRSPLFVMIALTINSAPTSVADSKLASTVGSGAWHPRMFRRIVSEVCSSYDVSESSSLSSSQSKLVSISRLYLSFGKPSGTVMKKVTTSLSPLSRSSIIS